MKFELKVIGSKVYDMEILLSIPASKVTETQNRFIEQAEQLVAQLGDEDMNLYENVRYVYAGPDADGEMIPYAFVCYDGRERGYPSSIMADYGLQLGVNSKNIDKFDKASKSQNPMSVKIESAETNRKESRKRDENVIKTADKEIKRLSDIKQKEDVTIEESKKKQQRKDASNRERKARNKAEQDMKKERKKLLNAARNEYRQKLEAKKEELRAKLAIKGRKQPPVIHTTVRKRSSNTALSSAFAKIPYGKAGSVAMFNSQRTDEFLTHISATVAADVVVPEKKYKYPKIVQDTTIERFRELKDIEMQKAVFFTYRGCLACATFFQILVSNTPMDEDYTYETEVIGSDRIKYYGKNGKLKNTDTMLKEAKVGTRTVRRKHRADEEYIRGDWTITFRGKTFKAFESAPAKDSESMQIDYTFNEADFYKKSDPAAIERIANVMFELTKDSDDLSSVWSEHNINPRWLRLEYGGWYTRQTKMARGAKYTHRVDSTLLSYQAPRGFWRVARAQYKALVTSGRWKGSIENYINSNKNKLDVSKIESVAMKSLFELYPDLKRKSHTLGVYK